MDMHAPGVEVRPIRQANGRSEFGELFLTDVRIPAENMIGAENNGWRIAQATLGSERGVIAFEGAERQRYEIEAFYRKSLKTGAAWLRDTQLHREFVSFLAEMQAGRRLLRRVLEEHEKPDASASVLPSIIKLSVTVLRQRNLLLHGPDRRGRWPGIRHARGRAFRQPNVRFRECVFRHNRRRDE